MPWPQRPEEMFTKIADFYSYLTAGKALLETIRCPVLVMAGDRGKGVSVQHALHTAQLLRRTRLFG